LEIGLRRSRGEKGHYGILQNLKAVLRIITRVSLTNLRDTMPADMFHASYLPYEASKTYRAIMTEFECRRSNYLVEAQRQRLQSV
jgi:hypothetical protein